MRGKIRVSDLSPTFRTARHRRALALIKPHPADRAPPRRSSPTPLIEPVEITRRAQWSRPGCSLRSRPLDQRGRCFAVGPGPPIEPHPADRACRDHPPGAVVSTRVLAALAPARPAWLLFRSRARPADRACRDHPPRAVVSTWVLAALAPARPAGAAVSQSGPPRRSSPTPPIEPVEITRRAQWSRPGCSLRSRPLDQRGARPLVGARATPCPTPARPPTPQRAYTTRSSARRRDNNLLGAPLTSRLCTHPGSSQTLRPACTAASRPG